MIIQTTQGARRLRAASSKGRWGDSIVRVTPNGHLHLAIAVALLVCLALALTVPISRTAAGEDTRALRIPSGAIAETLGVPAGPLTQALAERPDGSYSERVAPLLAINLIPEPLLKLTGQVARESFPELGALAGPHHTFSVYQDGLTTSYSSALTTVGEALADAGVSIGPGDIVYPDPNSAMAPGMHVFIDHATEVTLIVGGEERQVYTHVLIVGELLDEQNVEVQEKDIVSARSGLMLHDGMTITVTTVRGSTEYEESPIPFHTVYTYDPNVTRGEQLVKQTGANGHLKREYLITVIDGEETSEIVSETVTLPVDRIVAIGTQVPPVPEGMEAVFPVAPGEEITCGGGILRVWATWYTAASSGGSGITKTGTGVYKGIIAVDPNVIPLGTHLYVPGYGFGIAADTGGGVKGNWIDLGYGADDVKDWHTGYADICIID